MEVILSAAEKYPWDNRRIANQVKKNLDERLGASWHVVVGETYSFEITYESECLIYLYYGSLAILCWKCGTVLLNEMKHKMLPHH